MGIHTTAYAAYGLRLPGHIRIEDVEEYVDSVAGAYDHDAVYLVTECVTADLGETHPIPVDKPRADWDQQLHAAAVGLGLAPDEVPAPGWFVVVDQS
jgi:hypothetical protein